MNGTMKAIPKRMIENMLSNYEQRFYEDGCKVWANGSKNLNCPAHWHTEYEILRIFNGSAYVQINEKKYEAKDGDTFLIKSCDLHTLYPKTSYESTAIVFDRSIVEDVFDMELENPKLSSTEKFVGLYDIIKKELVEKPPFYGPKVNHLVFDALIEIFRHEKTKPKEASASPLFERLKKLIHAIEENPDLSFSDAAKTMYFSESYFSKIFHTITGVSYSKYVNYKKVEKTIELIKENPDMSFTEVSIAAGFSSIRQFNRVFKEITGYTPSSLPKNFILNTHPMRAFTLSSTSVSR